MGDQSKIGTGVEAITETSVEDTCVSWKQKVLAKANNETNVDNNVDAFQALLIRDLKSDISKAERKLAIGEENFNNKSSELIEELSELIDTRAEIITTIDLKKITTLAGRKAYKVDFIAAVKAIDAKIKAKTAEISAIESAYQKEVDSLKEFIESTKELLRLFK